jgi:hypothetical protein
MESKASALGTLAKAKAFEVSVFRRKTETSNRLRPKYLSDKLNSGKQACITMSALKVLLTTLKCHFKAFFH